MARTNRAMLLAGWFLACAAPALAGWETAGKIGFDTNVTRAVDGGEGDAFLAGYAAYLREPSGEKRHGFTFAGSVEGGVFFDFRDLSYAAVTVEPGIVYFPRWWATLSAAPFLRGRSVADSDQSSVSFGGKISLRERVRPNLFLGQYYRFTENRAGATAFTYTEHAWGVSLGGNLSGKVHAAAGYEFAVGETFRSLASAATFSTGSGRHRMFSGAFGSDVVREDVDRHTFSLSVETMLSPSAFAQAGYAFSAYDGELSSFDSHSAYAGAGYRF